MPRLDDEQLEAFAHHYVQKFNGVEAALAAGLTDPTLPGARTNANGRANLALLRPDVARRIRELNDAQLRRIDATADRTMRELGRISFSDVRYLFREDGTLRDITELENDPAAAVKAVKIERRRVKNGFETDLVTGKKVPVYDDYETLEIKMHDKVATLGILAKHFKIVGDEGDGINALASVLADRLKGARTRVLARQPTQEIEDARFTNPDVPIDLADAGAREAVPRSGDGDRPDLHSLG